MTLSWTVHFIFLAMFFLEGAFQSHNLRRLDHSRHPVSRHTPGYDSPELLEKYLMCGDYYKLSATDVGHIVNPNYPEEADVMEFCIWLIEAPQNYRVNLTLHFHGTMIDDECVDFVQVRNHDKKGPILGQFCDKSNDHVTIQSMGQWLWMMLKTSRAGNVTKLYSTFNAFTDVNSSVMIEKDHKKKGQERECRSYEFECRNKECISLSYRCDNVNDCGCKVDCDESGCEGIELGKYLQFIIGLSIGVFVFVSVCFVTCLIEGQSNWIASRVEELRMRENQAEERRKKAFKAFTKFIGEKEV